MSCKSDSEAATAQVQLSENSVLKEYHPDAVDMINVSDNLEKILLALRDKSKRFPRQVAFPGTLCARGALAAPLLRAPSMAPYQGCAGDGRGAGRAWRGPPAVRLRACSVRHPHLVRQPELVTVPLLQTAPAAPRRTSRRAAPRARSCAGPRGPWRRHSSSCAARSLWWKPSTTVRCLAARPCKLTSRHGCRMRAGCSNACCRADPCLLPPVLALWSAAAHGWRAGVASR